MKPNKQTKLEYCISLMKRLPSFQYEEKLLFIGWDLFVIGNTLLVDGDDEIKPRNEYLKKYDAILTALIADLERHLGEKKTTIEKPIFEVFVSNTIFESMNSDVDRRIGYFGVNDEFTCYGKFYKIVESDGSQFGYKLVELTGSEGKGGEE